MERATVASKWDAFYTVHEGDARRIDELLRRRSGPKKPLITCTITSPPYANLIDYGHPHQIGRGQSYHDYLADCRTVFEALHRHTRDAGSLWVIADTVLDQSRDPSALRPLPFDLAAQAGEVGWTLRDAIIWKKDKTRPWSNRGRLRNAFEYVLFFVKTDAYKYHIDRLRDAIELAEWWVQYPERYNPQGKAPTNVWNIPIPVQGSWAHSAVQHACPLPPDLVEKIVFLSTDPGDVVFDPFAGSGTVVAEAERLGRRGLGIEINSTYVDAYRELVRPEILERRGTDELADRLADSNRLSEVILKLRAIKYPKAMFQQHRRRHPRSASPRLAVVLVEEVDSQALRNPHQLIDVTTVFVCDGSEAEREELQAVMKEIAEHRPLTKYGVSGNLRVIPSEGLVDFVRNTPLYLYEHGRTWFTTGRISLEELLATPMSNMRGGYLPIAANVAVQERPRRIYA